MVVRVIGPTSSSVPTIPRIEERYLPVTDPGSFTANQSALISDCSNLSFEKQPRTSLQFIDEDSGCGTSSTPVIQPNYLDQLESQQTLSQSPLPPPALACEYPDLLTSRPPVSNLSSRSLTDRRSTPHPNSPGVARGPPIVYSDSHLSSFHAGEGGYRYGRGAPPDRSDGSYSQMATLEKEVSRLKKQLEYANEELITKERELVVASNASSVNRETAITVYDDLQGALVASMRLQDENDQYRSRIISLETELAAALGEKDKYELKSKVLSASLGDVLDGYGDMRKNRHQKQLSRGL